MQRLGLFVVLFSTCVSGVAVAGEKLSDPVIVSTKAGWAAGSFGSARNSSDHQQTLVCGLASYTTPAGELYTDVNCFARTALGDSAACMRTHAPLALREAVMAMSDAAHVKFVWNEAGECTAIYVTHSSANEPRN